MQIDQIPRAICHSLLVELREEGLEELPAHDARFDTALGDILNLVERQCRIALKAKNNQFMDECLYVLDKLGPDAKLVATTSFGRSSENSSQDRYLSEIQHIELLQSRRTTRAIMRMV
jgi:hypothetical protein